MVVVVMQVLQICAFSDAVVRGPAGDVKRGETRGEWSLSGE